MTILNNQNEISQSVMPEATINDKVFIYLRCWGFGQGSPKKVN